MPIRRANEHYRPEGEHLTEEQVTQLMNAARARGRHGHRDATMILLAFRHGLRVSELVGLRWGQINFTAKTLRVVRVKNGSPSMQFLADVEIIALEQLRPTPFQHRSPVFIGERGPLSPAAFAQMLRRAAEYIDFPVKAHPHMLRHACGYKLVNQGVNVRAIQHHLGHKNIQHTVRYTTLVPQQGFWND